MALATDWCLYRLVSGRVQHAMTDPPLRCHDPRWARSAGLAVRGRAFGPAGGAVDLDAHYRPAMDLRSIIEATEELSGFFAAVRTTEEAVYLVTDHARSVPLYFTTTTPLRVSDRVDSVDPTQYDPVAASEFALTRYVTRGETLRPEVRTVQAGEVVRIPRDDPGAFERRSHHRYQPTTRLAGDRDAVLDRMGDVLDVVFERAAAVIGDRPVVVPLSGGLDSRLVATELVDRGFDVTAFTFGRRGHADVEVSRDVARTLGIDWEWIEYTPARWHEWYQSADRQAYHDQAFNGDALPFLAEWPAVKELLEADRLPGDPVVCPGHTVATTSESVPSRWYDGSPAEPGVVSHVLDTQYALWDWDDADYRRIFSDRIAADAGLGHAEGVGGAIAAYERWLWQTRLTTFTHGDLRVYDWFDLDWWLPLGDVAFVDFWQTVPARLRRDKTLQTTYAVDRYAEVGGVDRSAARRTDREWTPFDQIRRTFQAFPLVAYRGGFDEWLGVQAWPREQWERWGNYPLGWYGVIPEPAADRFAAAKNLYALRTLEAIGRLSFDPPWIADAPLSRSIDLPPVGATD